MNVSGTNPITTSGTFVFGLANVSAGAVFTGPASGADAAPTFKAISSFAANPALSNLAGVEINTPLITGVGTSLDLEAGARKTDAAADTAILKAGNAFPGAATNTAGANTILAGGIGKRIFTVVDYSHGSMSGSTVTITINGSATVLTEGVEWTAATNNNATAESLASALGGLSGMGASASAADVRIVADVGTYSLTIAKTAADAGMTATSGADGQLRLEGTLNGTSGAPPIVFGANNLGFYGYSNGIVYTYLGFPLSYFSTNGIVIYSTYQYLWGAGDAISTPDLGLARSSPGLLKVTDASTGHGNIIASTAITAVGTATYNGVIRTGVYKRAWTNAEVTAFGAVLSGDLKVATLPAKTVVRNAYLVIDSQASGTTTLTASLGRTSTAYIDYIVASNAKVAANTVYGDATTVERGTNLTGWDLPSYTVAVDIYLQFVATDASKKLEDVLGCTGTIFLLTETLP